MDSGFQELVSRCYVSRTWIPSIPQFRISGILDFLSCIQDSKAKVSWHPDSIANTLLLDAAVEKLQYAWYNKPTMVSARSTTFHKKILDSEFHSADSRLQVLDFEFVVSETCGFRIPWAGFQIPKPRIPDTTIKKFFRIPHPTSKNLPSSGIRIILHEAKL